MSRPPFTPSSAARAAVCLGAEVLPRADRATAGATLGTAKHRFLERVPDVGRDAALAEVADPATRAQLEGLDLDALKDILDRRAFVAELALAWDVETGAGRELARGRGRHYADISPTEIPGTADAAGLVEPHGGVVLDFKSEHEDQPDAARHWQLRLLALMFARAFGRDEIRVYIVRPSDDGARRQGATFDAFELADIADEARDLARRVWRAREAYARDGTLPPLVVGPACARCPCLRMGCPAVTAQLRGIVEAVARGRDVPGDTAGDHLLRLWGLDGQGTSWTVTPEVAGHAKSRLVAIREALEAADEAIDLVARQEDVPLPDGRVYGVRHEVRTTYDGRAVFAAVAARHGADVAWSAVEIRAPKTRVEDALKAVAAAGGAKRGRLAVLTRELESDLMGIQGGLTVRPLDVLRIQRRKEDR